MATEIKRTGLVACVRAVVAAAATVVVLGAAPGAASAQAPREYFGIVPQGPLDASSFEGMARANVGTVRLKIDWAAIDGSPAPDDYYWPIFDPLVLDAARNGIRVLPFIEGTPAWVARELDGRSCADSTCHLYAPRSRQARKAWRRFVAGAVERYGPNGTLWAENPEVPKLPFDEWQIWNEQNSEVFFEPRPRPKRYARMLAAASRAVRQGDPTARVILGGMAELAGTDHAIDASRFLARLYRIKRARRNFDGVASHPYGGRMTKVRSQIRGLRRVMRRAGDAKTPIYVTEIGASSAEGENTLTLGLEGQADLLNRIYAYCERKRRRFDIRIVAWFSWQDSGGGCLWCANSGLLTESGEAKPSYGAFTRFSSAASSAR